MEAKELEKEVFMKTLKTTFAVALLGASMVPMPARAVEIVVTNSLPIADDKRFDKLTVLTIAPLLGRAIREGFEDGSVTSLFDGHS